MNDNASRALICEIGRRLYDKDLVAANEGNLSLRLNDIILTTPTGLCKGLLEPDDLVTTNLEGEQLSGTRRVSSEIRMHVEVYRHRPEARAICHGHPVYATAHAVAGIPLLEAMMPEVVLSLGCVPVAPYGTPSTQELADTLIDLVPDHEAILLANHGAITYAEDLEKALFKMEILEHFAKIAILTKVLGRQTLLSEDNVHKLFNVQSNYGIKASDSPQAECHITAKTEPTSDAFQGQQEDLFSKVVSEVRKGN